MSIVGRIAVCLVACLATSQGTALASFPGDNGGLAYVSNRDGNQEIYVTQQLPPIPGLGSITPPCELNWPDKSLAGTQLVERRLTASPASDGGPAWGPRVAGGPNADQVDIAFHSDRDGDFEIYAMPANLSELVGTVPRKLTNNTGVDDTDPAWQTSRRIVDDTLRRPSGSDPDPVRIAFVSDRDGNRDIYAMDPDGGNVTRLTDDPADDSSPSWSPDGTQIAFVSDRDGQPALYVTAADHLATPERISAAMAAPATAPEWQRWPDPPPGTERLVFEAPALELATPRAGIPYAAYESAVRGGAWQRLTDDPSDVRNPTWAPQGDCLAFDAGAPGDRQVYVRRSDGQRLRISGGGQNWAPDWESLENVADDFSNPPAAGPSGGVTCTKTGAPGRDRLYGTAGNDVLCGLGGNDRLVGRGGDDVLVGGAGRDWLSGGGGNDSVFARDGQRDSVSGGRGRDTAVFDRGRDRTRSVETRR
jgi:TolB protein